ncbi:hypothetical protein [Streptomyces xiamenensis]|uniref:hypothetical protein n=1 Tax=Streptomyces xiamenensis TaxID=408015 RepID=UPI003D743F60
MSTILTAATDTAEGLVLRGWSARVGELAVRLADVRQRERAHLVCLEAFVRENVLPRTHPNSTERQQVLEALGENCVDGAEPGTLH